MNHPVLKKLAVYLPFLSLIAITAKTQQPTWANGIACIIYTHCSPCHNSNGIAPFPLMSYQDAFDNASGIQSDVISGKMPPYPPDRSYQHYQNEKYLSDSEKLAIRQWVQKGAPSGNLRKAPSPPVYDYKNEITNPDFSAAIPVFTIPEMSDGDLYRCFVISNPLPGPNYISSIEVIPGDRSAVHHVQIFQDTSMIPVTLDSADSLPGYTEFGGIGSKYAEHITGWTPSSGAINYPPNTGAVLNAGSRIIIQIHYPATAVGKVDSTRINFKYIEGTGHIRPITMQNLLDADNLINGPLRIPANKVKTFYEQYTLPDKENVSLLGVAPHAHLICISLKAYAVKPNGDTVPLINIPKWDFHWQGGYVFKKIITLPGGSTLFGEGVFDNTENNPENPSNPPKLVKRGEASTNEMMQFNFTTLKTKVGDDTIVFDTTTRLPTYNNCGFVIKSRTAAIKESIALNESISENTSAKLVSIYPNPVHDKLQLTLKTTLSAKILFYNINGQLVYETSARQGNNQVDLQFLSNGSYLIKVINSKLNTTLRFVKQ